ncbi:MAG TPA: phage tail protein [Allosphingosinicella sp.]|jgi:hypothetical protein
MATLVLTAVGQVVGGPIGGAIGAFLGQQVDQRLFAPKPRQGPRLTDLAVQTSSYGSDIPKVFGRMRVAGTVIWSTDLEERRASHGGGKGQPKTVDYSYSASFAVALSGRPIRGVGRIWADGKLLRGAGGDFKSRTGYRLYPGDEAQPIDPLIASVEGAGAAPAYRGIAYALFEDFELADYGNRIPSLTFEVEADSGPVTVAGIAEALSGGEIAAGPSPALVGYAASGDSVRSVIEALAAAADLALAERDGGTVLGEPDRDAAVALRRKEMDAGGARAEIVRQGAGSVPGEVSLAYYDPERDFQTGLQRAAYGAPGIRGERRGIAAAMTAAQAKGLAERRLQSLWAGRERASVHLPWSRTRIRPGTVVTVEGHAGLWRVVRFTLERTALTLELVRLAPVAAGAAAATPGRPIGHPDLRAGPTRLVLLDTPLAGDGAAPRPRLLVLAAGAEAGWRRAELSVSYDSGTSWQGAGATAPAAVIGTALSVPGPAGSALLDEHGRFDVELLGDEMWLESRTDGALAGGANVAALGDELIQFGRAEPLGGRHFRLSRLLRGRRGTEWAASGHAPGEAFALIDAAVLVAVEPPLAALGAEARILAAGLGDGPDTEPAAIAVTGEAMRPPSPVHLAARRLPGGDVAVDWVRRSRLGWVWLDGADAPLGEEREAYRLTLTTASSRRVAEPDGPAFVYAAADQAADGAAGPLRIEAVQLGAAAASRPAILNLD